MLTYIIMSCYNIDKYFRCFIIKIIDYMVNSISEVAKELNDDYQEALEIKAIEGFKKGDKSKIFLNILKMLFARYGEFFGYKDLSSFKSDVIFVQKRLKKAKGILVYPAYVQKLSFSTPLILKKPNQAPPAPKEGDGEIFLYWEIEFFGLNPESY